MVRGPTGNALALVVLGLAVILAYSDSLRGPFVYDDLPAIIGNPTLRHPTEIGSLLNPPGDEAGTVGGRPMLNLTLALNFAISGPQTWSYHVANLGIHVAATLLLSGLIRRTLAAPDIPPGVSKSALRETKALVWTSSWDARDATLIAFFSALLWAVHPLQTESVTYVVQRAESLAGLFYFLTLYCFVRSVREKSGGGVLWRWGCFIACLFGMATKEVMVSAPLAVLWYDAAFVSGSIASAWRARRGLFLALGATWSLLAVLVTGTHGRGGSAGFASGVGVWPYLLTQCEAIVRYLRLSFWPDRLVFDYGTGLVNDAGEVIGQILVVLLLIFGAVVTQRRRPALGFVALFFFAVLAPSSSFVPIATEPMAEHRMYLPLAAVALLAVLALFALLSRWSRTHARVALGCLGSVAVLALGAATFCRNRDYRSDVSLWTDTVEKAPQNPRAHNNLAEALRGAGDSAGATREFATAVRIDPDYAPAQYNLGVTLLDGGQPQDAIGHLEKALTAPRHQAELHTYLGEAFERLGNHGEAASQFREALRRAPENSEAAFGLGNNLAVLGQFSEAIEAFRHAVTLAPDRARIRNNLANALLLSGRIDDAIAEYREACRLDPTNGEIRANLERALAGSSRP